MFKKCLNCVYYIYIYSYIINYRNSCIYYVTIFENKKYNIPRVKGELTIHFVPFLRSVRIQARRESFINVRIEVSAVEVNFTSGTGFIRIKY